MKYLFYFLTLILISIELFTIASPHYPSPSDSAGPSAFDEEESEDGSGGGSNSGSSSGDEYELGSGGPCEENSDSEECDDCIDSCEEVYGGESSNCSCDIHSESPSDCTDEVNEGNEYAEKECKFAICGDESSDTDPEECGEDVDWNYGNVPGQPEGADNPLPPACDLYWEDQYCANCESGCESARLSCENDSGRLDCQCKGEGEDPFAEEEDCGGAMSEQCDSAYDKCIHACYCEPFIV